MPGIGGITVYGPLGDAAAGESSPVLRVEISEYARELAQVVFWIGYLQWMTRNGFQVTRDPILEPLETIRLQDALLDRSEVGKPEEAAWPAADVIIGNPPSQERDRLQRKAERIRTLYLEGGIDDRKYRRQRAEVAEALAAIPVDDLPASEAVGRGLAALLADRSAAWTVATPEERNRIARELFADVVIENRTTVAVKPRPELALFFRCQ